MPDKLTGVPETRFDETPETVQGVGRSRVGAVLSGPAIIIVQPREVRDLVESLMLEEGYTDACETQRFFQLLKTGEKTPDFGQVLSTFTPEMLAVAQGFQEPTLVLTTKGRTFDDLILAINRKKTMPGQRDSIVGRTFYPHIEKRAANWGAYIVEGPIKTDVHHFDDVDRFLDERFANFAGHKRTKRVSGMDRWKYIQLMMQGLRRRKPIDAEFRTILDEDPALSEGKTPQASWESDHKLVYFHWGVAESAEENSRFRRSVGGEVHGD